MAILVPGAVVGSLWKNHKFCISPFCLYPKMRSIHWWIWHETNSDSKACRLILTNSWGVEAQGGSSTLLTSVPSSIWPNLKPFMLTNISGRQKNSGINSCEKKKRFRKCCSYWGRCSSPKKREPNRPFLSKFCFCHNIMAHIFIQPNLT